MGSYANALAAGLLPWAVGSSTPLWMADASSQGANIARQLYAQVSAVPQVRVGFPLAGGKTVPACPALHPT